MVPEGWKVCRLDDIADYRRGSFPQPYGLDKWFDDNGHPFVQVYDVDSNLKLKQFTKTKISDLAAEQSVFAPKGTILVTLQGSIGRVAITQYSAYVDRTLLVVRGLKLPGDKFYLATALQELFAKEKEKAPGGTIKTITKAVLSNFQIFWPPWDEQKKIAQILSTWDQAITATERLLENSRQRKKALMQQLLTGKKRLPGFEGEWEGTKLEQLIRESRKVKVDNPSEIELLTVKLHYKGVVPSGKYPNPTTNGRPYFRRNAGELIIGRQNIHNGGVGLVPPECDGLIASNAITSFEPRECTDIRFILYLMSTDRFRFIVDNLSGGTGQKELSTRELLKLSIKVPSLAEQNAIAEVLCKADSEIQRIASLLGQLSSEKKALMQQLLTGKRRVRVDSEAA